LIGEKGKAAGSLHGRRLCCVRRFQQVFLIEKLSAPLTTLNDGLYIAKDGQRIAAVLLRLLPPARALPTVIKRGNRRPKPIADSGNGGGSETVSDQGTSQEVVAK
jgi:hypothetical protein